MTNAYKSRFLVVAAAATQLIGGAWGVGTKPNPGEFVHVKQSDEWRKVLRSWDTTKMCEAARPFGNKIVNWKTDVDRVAKSDPTVRARESTRCRPLPGPPGSARDLKGAHSLRRQSRQSVGPAAPPPRVAPLRPVEGHGLGSDAADVAAATGEIAPTVHVWTGDSRAWRVVRLLLSYLRVVLSCALIFFFVALCLSALAAAGGQGRAVLKTLTFKKIGNEDAGPLKLALFAFGFLMLAVASMKFVMMFEFVGVNMPVSVRDSDLRKAMGNEAMSSDFLLSGDAEKDQHLGTVTKADHCSQMATVALGPDLQIKIPMSELKEEEVGISKKFLKIDGSCSAPQGREMCCLMYKVQERRFLFDRLFLAPMRFGTSSFLKSMLGTSYIKKRIFGVTFRGPVWVYGSQNSKFFGCAGVTILIVMGALVATAVVLANIPNSVKCGSEDFWESAEQSLSLGALGIISLFGLGFVFALQTYKFFTSEDPVVFGVVLLFIFSKSFMIFRIGAPFVIPMVCGVSVSKDLAHTTPGFLLGEIPLFFVGAIVAMFFKKNFNPQDGAEVASHFYFVVAVDILKTAGYYGMFWRYNKSWTGSGSGWFAGAVTAMERKASWVKVIMTVAIHIVADVGQLASSLAVKAIATHCSESTYCPGLANSLDRISGFCSDRISCCTKTAPEAPPTDAQKQACGSRFARCLRIFSPFARFAIWMERGFTLTIAAPIISELIHNEFKGSNIGTVTPEVALTRLIKSVEILDGYRAAGSLCNVNVETA